MQGPTLIYSGTDMVDVLVKKIWLSLEMQQVDRMDPIFTSRKSVLLWKYHREQYFESF